MAEYLHFFREDSLHLEEHDKEELESRRLEMTQFCVEANKLCACPPKEEGKYRLDVTTYFTKKGCGDHTGADIYCGQDLLLHINRNYDSFWHYWVLNHPKTGHDYLLCGEDYQGYNVIDLTTKTNYAYLPKAAKQGIGWCFIEVEGFDVATMQLSVAGCFWACPYDRIIFDFSDPAKIPMPILSQEEL